VAFAIDHLESSLLYLGVHFAGQAYVDALPSTPRQKISVDNLKVEILGGLIDHSPQPLNTFSTAAAQTCEDFFLTRLFAGVTELPRFLFLTKLRMKSAGGRSGEEVAVGGERGVGCGAWFAKAAVSFLSRR